MFKQVKNHGYLACLSQRKNGSSLYAISTLLLLILLLVLCSCSDSGNDTTDGDFSESESAPADRDADDDSSVDGDLDAERSDASEWDIDPELAELWSTDCVGSEPPDLGGFEVGYQRLSCGDYTLDKNYYLLTLFEELTDLHGLLVGDATLSAISQTRTQMLREAETACGEDVACHTGKLTITEADCSEIAAALGELVEKGSTDVVSEHLRPSGMFQLHRSLPDDELFETAFCDTVAGLNEAYHSNVGGLSAAELNQLVQTLSQAHQGDLLFYEPLYFATAAVLTQQQRDEAGRYEPMEEGENAAALQAMAEIDWDSYPYSLILVPGMGPDNYEEPLDQAGAFRCDLAVQRLWGGLAPFILTSGGHVHPDRTPYCEAIEMKKYLMNTYDVPESKLLVDPHARHTTTNLRNLARLVLRYGIPPEKPVLVTTDMGQSIYISSMIAGRCEEELGYLPYRQVLSLGMTDTCLLIDPTSLYADPSDPLDP